MTAIERVNTATGEIVPAPYSLKEFLAKFATPEALEENKQLAALYDRAVSSLIGPGDVQKEGDREFKKKSAWRKLGRFFGISTHVVSITREIVEGNFTATVVVRAVAPWGQSAEAVGACGADEESGRREITAADAIATAETRATNRAVSNLIAMGEVSAEEMRGEGKGSRRKAEKEAAAADPGAFLIPFGRTKGKKLSEVPRSEVEGFRKWCTDTNETKFRDAIEACTTYLAKLDTAAVAAATAATTAATTAAPAATPAPRPSPAAGTPAPFEEFPLAPEGDGEDDLPF